MSVITDHCGCVFPLFLFHFVYCSTECFFDRCMVNLCVFSSDLLSSGYLFSSAIDASCPADLRGVGLAAFFVRFRLFAMFRFHLIFLIWWIISGSSLPRNIDFDAGYRLIIGRTALFGLNIDNLVKLASALPYSIWQ